MRTVIYRITERLIVDHEVGFDVDIDRCIDLINKHRNVAVGTFDEAVHVLRGLGFTDGSIGALIAASKPITEEDLYALPR